MLLYYLLNVYLAATFSGVLTLIGMGIVGVIGAVIGWRVSELFIPPRDHWAKSFFAVFLVKLGIAAAGAFFAVMGAAYFAVAIFG